MRVTIICIDITWEYRHHQTSLPASLLLNESQRLVFSTQLAMLSNLADDRAKVKNRVKSINVKLFA